MNIHTPLIESKSTLGEKIHAHSFRLKRQTSQNQSAVKKTEFFMKPTSKMNQFAF